MREYAKEQVLEMYGEKALEKTEAYLKDGNVVSDKVGTISLEEEQTKYSEFTNEQHEELKQIYSELFSKVYPRVGNTCSDDETCD